MSKQCSFLKRDPALHQKVRRERRRIANNGLVGVGYEQRAFGKLRVEELNVTESDQLVRMIIQRRYARHRRGFARVDDFFAGLWLQLGHRWMLEPGQKIVGKLTL